VQALAHHPPQPPTTMIDSSVRALTKNWGSFKEVSLYLDRCQIDTPMPLVERVWHQVAARRSRKLRKVVDFGAGDGRFAKYGSYSQYVGFEVDRVRTKGAVPLPVGAELANECAFSSEITDASLCIGNPPFVRNQDLPAGWRERTATILHQRTGIHISGLANAWQHFFLLSLASTRKNGLVALVIPYEWVSRPSSANIRDFIRKNNWNVAVYRLLDSTFPRVLTTSSITVIDKAKADGGWAYFEEDASGAYSPLLSVTSSTTGLIKYSKRSDIRRPGPFAKRGLSPGTQKVLTLTESERARLGLRIDRDVVRCITTLRHAPFGVPALTKRFFERHYVKAGEKCWLVNVGLRTISDRLRAYFDSVPPARYQTSTCLNRKEWWKFIMPQIPDVLVSTGFTKQYTKAVANTAKVHAVGSVCGIYKVGRNKKKMIAEKLRKANLGDGVVAHSNGLRKIEINQLNTVLNQIIQSEESKIK
jgi:hypothetical protein